MLPQRPRGAGSMPALKISEAIDSKITGQFPHLSKSTGRAALHPGVD